MTKKRFHTSLQLKLTLLLSLLMIISCVLMYFFISHSAVSGMDGLQNYMIKVDPQDGDSPITFNVDPKALFPQFEQEIQETKCYCNHDHYSSFQRVYLFSYEKGPYTVAEANQRSQSDPSAEPFHPAGSSQFKG